MQLVDGLSSCVGDGGGGLGYVPVSSRSADEFCLEPLLEPPFAEDATEPDPGLGFYYLLRATNVCGTSIWGFSSTDDERISFVCP